MKRTRREKREWGRLMALAFNEPESIDESFPDPPEVEAGVRHSATMETEKWW